MISTEEKTQPVDPVHLSNMVLPVTYSISPVCKKTLDLVTILQLYKIENGSLAGEGFITCPLTRIKVRIEPSKLQINSNIKIESSGDYVGLPVDSEIIEFIFKTFSWKHCEKYLCGTDLQALLQVTNTENKKTILMLASQYQPNALNCLLNTLEAMNDEGEQAKQLGMVDEDGFTALMFAAKYHQKAVTHIVNSISRLKCRDTQRNLLVNANECGRTALMIASRYQPNSVTLILGEVFKLYEDNEKFTHLENQDNGGYTALMIAAQRQPDALFKILQFIFSCNNKLKLLKQLRLTNADGQTPLMLAVQHQIKSVSYMLDAIDKLDDTDQQAAIISEINIAKRQDFIHREYSQFRWNALMIAARYQPDAVRPLLGAISNLRDEVKQAELIDTRDNNGNTALIIARKFQSDAVAPIQEFQEFMEVKFDKSKKMSEHFTPTMGA